MAVRPAHLAEHRGLRWIAHRLELYSTLPHLHNTKEGTTG